MNQDITNHNAQLIDMSAMHYRAGRFELSLAQCQDILARDADHAMAWNNASAALASLDRWVDAYAYVQRALVLAPTLVDPLTNGAHIAAKLGRFIEAANYLRALGWMQYQNKEVTKAIEMYQQALVMHPHDVDALHILAGLTSEQGHKEQALALMNQALAINPDHLATLAAKGNLIGAEFRQDAEAEACFLRALKLNAQHWMSLYNYGVFLGGRGRYSEAIAMYEKAGRVDPRHHLPFWNLANLLLRLGDYPRAWPLYEWRWQTDHLKPAYLALPMPLWTGQDLQGKRVLLHFEQGYGDGFQFIRFAKEVASRGAHVTIFMPKEICRTFEGCAGVHEIIPWDVVPHNFDYHAPLMSLPAPLGLTIDNIPNQVPYLFAKPDLVSQWRNRLPALRDEPTPQKLRVGLAWCGRPTHENDAHRSMAFRELLPLIEAFAQVQFVSVQVAPRATDIPGLEACRQIVRIEQYLTDFSETAALAMNLDLLISVDTSVVHLTAALGKPVWVMLPSTSDWRWLIDREDTPWYPHVRLFRQSATDEVERNWSAVRERLMHALQELLLKL